MRSEYFLLQLTSYYIDRIGYDIREKIRVPFSMVGKSKLEFSYYAIEDTV